ncbi:Gfo/Idh/MocA family oxidoreductase [Micromonospora rifamycinica]|uniref:Gfo/Idh/MocA family protein n=1 Tax=Micromonospora rifamycinica TaxID=291594 RepID=UPI003431FD72
MTIRWGFLGAGSIARSSVGPAIRNAPGHTLYAVAARDERRAAALRPTRTYRRYEQLLEDPEVDAVYVCLHNRAHRFRVGAALRHGKHVLCEKPLGLTAAEVTAMTAEAAAARRLLVEAAWNRWHPRTRAAEALLTAGAVGRVEQVVARFHGASPAPGNYRREAALGGGALWDVGCYAVAGALSALSWQQPTAVTATMTSWDGSDADLATRARLAFGTTTAVDLVAALDGRDEQILEVRGDAGVLRLLRPAFTAGTAPATLQLTLDGAAPRTIEYPATDPYRLMVEAFGLAVRGENAWLVSLAESSAVATTIDAIRAASLAPDPAPDRHRPGPVARS